MDENLPSLATTWNEHAEKWIAWARAPGHDTYWVFHRKAFFESCPSPGRLTLDVGCGEGRVSRDLRAAGHRVVGLDRSMTLARAARESDPQIPVCVGDGAFLPYANDEADVVVAFMSLHDIEDMPRAVSEIARVLAPGGIMHAAVVHPFNSGGRFPTDRPDGSFVIEESYFTRRRYADTVERDGLTMTFASKHYTLEDYFSALGNAGLVMKRVREVTNPDHPQWKKMPMFLHLQAVLTPV